MIPFSDILNKDYWFLYNNNNDIDNNTAIIVSCFHKDPQMYKGWVFLSTRAQLIKALLIKLILDKWKF